MALFGDEFEEPDTTLFLVVRGMILESSVNVEVDIVNTTCLVG